MFYIDTETCGLTGPLTLLQYAENDSEIKLHDAWKQPVGDTVDLLDAIAKEDVCGFNLAFDWFQISKLRNIFDMVPRDWIPEDHIEEIALLEPEARTRLCIKPKRALDLMLVARKGKYQSLMDRKDIRIRKVPTVLAYKLAEELENRIEIDDVYFSRRKDKFAPKWKVYDIVRKGIIDPNFKDVVLKFAASGSLKNLAVHAGIADPNSLLRWGDVGCKEYPVECGWAPFALAIGKPGNWKGAWPDVIRKHISYWAYNPIGRRYAEDDVKNTRGLYYHLDKPEPGDNDSELACMVGAVRWRGFKINLEGIKELRANAFKKSRTAPKDPRRVLDYLTAVMDDTEQLALLGRDGKTSTKKPMLEAISRWEDDSGIIHPAAVRAKEVLNARGGKKEVELYDKLLQAGRFHASFVVIGALSGRMSGSDGLNPQGINHSKEVRRMFDLADDDMQLSGGDFDSFEVVLAEAVYHDENLRKDLTEWHVCEMCNGNGHVAPYKNKKGKESTLCPVCSEEGKPNEYLGKYQKKIHALFAMELFPGKTYQDIMLSKGSDFDMYTKGKQGVFSQIYGGDENTIEQKLGVDIEVARGACQRFQAKYEGVRVARLRIFDMFCSMRQPKGLGTEITWREPSDYIESITGFKRYFTLENKICRALFDLSQKPPKEWRSIPLKVVRREKMQTVSGALQSALYGAAFQIQAANMRAGANHEIQASGAAITKHVQRRVWDHQPYGTGKWLVVPFNVHDEVLAPCLSSIAEDIKRTVNETVESYREKVPLIKMEWNTSLRNWADK
jgi:hypothetical protein